MRATAVLILLTLSGCSTTQLIDERAAAVCEQYRDSGAQATARVLSALAVGYPQVRIFCTPDDAQQWAEQLQTGTAPEPQKLPEQVPEDLFQTAAALVLLPVDQRVILINSYPPATRQWLLAIMPGIERAAARINERRP